MYFLADDEKPYHKFLCLKPCGGHVDQNINQTPRRFFHYFSNSDCFLGVMSKLRNLNSESRQCGNFFSCPDLWPTFDSTNLQISCQVTVKIHYRFEFRLQWWTIYSLYQRWQYLIDNPSTNYPFLSNDTFFQIQFSFKFNYKNK